MKAQVLPFVLIRMFAFYFLYIAAVSLDDLLIRYVSLDSSVANRVLVNGLLIVAVPALFALFFWKKAEWLSGKVMGGKFGQDVISGAISFEDIQNTAFAAVGMFLLATSVPVVLRDITNLVLLALNGKNLLPVILHLALTGVQFALGAWLVLGARGISRFVRQRRHG